MNPRLSLRLAAILALSTLSTSGCRTLNDDSSAEEGLSQAVFAAIDSDSDGKSSASEMAAYQHREALAEFDLNDDKQISVKEWRVAKPSAPADAPHFKALDQNNDGEVTEEEAVALITANEDFIAAFAALDANGDTFLTWEEYEAGDSKALVVPLFGDETE
ncbi:MAG: hypothetical protein P1U86_04780 [Verrucomicrobiales bacterium]|nr:hypothetical protein [Verrucomicrobiales bacterium]